MNDESKPWLTEPDYLKWVDPATGYHCVIRRVPMLGSLCGYVRIPRGNLSKRIAAYMRRRAGPSFLPSRAGKIMRKVGYDHSAFCDIQVHGGLTYCDKLGRPTGGLHRGLWIGFDCGHAWDYMPAMYAKIPSLRWDIAPGDNGAMALLGEKSVYRDIAYVEEQVTSLAKQLKRAQR